MTETPKPTPTITETPEPTPPVTETPEPTPIITETPEPSPPVTETPEPTPTITETPEPEKPETPTLEPEKPETPQPARPATPAKAVLTKAASAGYDRLTVTWKKTKNANGYEVYRAASKNGKYKKAGETTGTSFTDSGLTTGKVYYYKVRACNTAGKAKAYGAYSDVKSARPIPAQAKIAKATGAKRSAKLVWKKTPGASGYTVCRAASKNGKYKAIKTLKGADKLTHTDKKLKKGKTYYYKVRAYRTVSGKKVYGPYSAAKSAKAK